MKTVITTKFDMELCPEYAGRLITSMPAEKTDTDLVSSILNGNAGDFELLVGRHKAKVFSQVSRRVPVNDIEDVAQEVFLRSYRSLASYSMKKPFENWLSVITVRCCCDYWRKNGKRQEISAPPAGNSFVDWLEGMSAPMSQDQFEKLSQRSEAGELLSWTLGKMTPEDRTLIEMLYFEDRSLKEAAEALEWGLSKTKVRAMRAKKKMRKIISGLMEDKNQL